MFRLKANKTRLYKLVGEFEDLPPMRRVTITKAYRTPDWWLKWTDADGLLCVAFFHLHGKGPAVHRQKGVLRAAGFPRGP